MDVGRLLDISEAHFSDKLALVSGEKKITYGQLKERVGRLMNGLIKLGVKKGDRICTLMRNCSELIEIYLATVRLGAIFTPLNFRLKAQELVFIISDAAPRIMVTDINFEEVAIKVMPEVPELEHLFSTSSNPKGDFRAYEDLVMYNEVYLHSPNLCSEDPCQLLYTSGTTGRPKGVLLSHENVLWNVVNMIQARNDRQEDVAIIIGPLFHAAALNSHYTSRLALGATSIIMDQLEPNYLMETIQKQKATVVSGTPTMFIILMEQVSPTQYDTTSVTTLTSGADKLPDHIKKALLDYFPCAGGIYDVYGCTECAPCVTTLDKRDSLRKTGSVGLPLPFVEVRLLDEDRQEVPMGMTGEIVVRGPIVMLGYYRQPEETSKVLKDGWLYTGDLARADDEGYLYIVDRKKDMIVSGGENIFAREVEEHLFYHPAVLKAAVFGLPDQKWGEKVTAAVVLRKGKQVDPEALFAYLKKRIAGYKVPKNILFMDKLPESSTGKVQKQVLKDMFTSKLSTH